MCPAAKVDHTLAVIPSSISPSQSLPRGGICQSGKRIMLLKYDATAVKQSEQRCFDRGWPGILQGVPGCFAARVLIDRNACRHAGVHGGSAGHHAGRAARRRHLPPRLVPSHSVAAAGQHPHGPGAVSSAVTRRDNRSFLRWLRLLSCRNIDSIAHAPCCAPS